MRDIFAPVHHSLHGGGGAERIDGLVGRQAQLPKFPRDVLGVCVWTQLFLRVLPLSWPNLRIAPVMVVVVVLVVRNCTSDSLRAWQIKDLEHDGFVVIGR